MWKRWNQNVRKIIMRAVTEQDWGADKQSLMYIYGALMRSTIDYGCFVYVCQIIRD